ncbi:adenylate/guanylate cyclase domain-containing protein [Legionella qingyii]|uniref:Adenylate/guanylate cyclase domain-containing protein n=1 Tax=Legionella qingyii TaxID=2184757 RepID=A0A317U4S3_9GAMM|nr:adenylate/guanylate cyclase domain-containing protein [Legionella qingyii]PWY56265.1 adenylate/guanylate cyclase domain-containing protein [Legionella qingyii]RUR22295.1 adenylate/guanylate cyclase domain-containing protein [Legionella qingyii]RUR25715.1 adenylate/guanylate cyclase domain-containing protein [Legionella qingyii]
MASNFKVSIRTSIITLFIFLLSLVGFTIIGINYLAFNKVLNNSAKDLIAKTSLLVKERFHVYLDPLNHSLIEIRDAIGNDIIDPDNQKLFGQFLFETIRYNPEMFMIHYGAANGDFFNINREGKIGLQLIHIVNSKPPFANIHYELDKQGKIVKKESITGRYDPRSRPWYQEVVQNGKPIWTNAYKFYLFGKKPGVTVAAPIYDKNKKLKGVVAIALTINGLQQFINELELTKNTMIYVINNDSNIIAFRDPRRHEDIRGKKLDPDLIKKLDIPSDLLRVNDFHPIKNSYVYEHQRYFYSYQPIFNKSGAGPWHIIIITPEYDAIAPLQKLSKGYILLTIFVLFIGVMLVRIVSQRISTPIIQLAEEAKKIRMFNLGSRPLLKTMIKEVSYLDRALFTLRSSLTSFQRYVPRSLVKKLVRTRKVAEVGGQNQITTILFSDIQNFATISESTSPQKLMTYLSDYFQCMTEVVIQHEGTLDKYIGDAVMAIWNAPVKDEQHVFHACETARAMQERIKKLNQKHKREEFPEFNIRIGIHTGEAIIGNVGSEDRLSYTALGDSVNLASRLESINKNYYTQIIVSHDTFTHVSEKFPFRLLDKVAVRGKRKSIAIYELITAQDLENLKQHKEEFTEAFSLYQKGLWEKSIKAFMRLTPAYPGDQLASVYIERCRILENTSPAHWDGVWRYEHN